MTEPCSEGAESLHQPDGQAGIQSPGDAQTFHARVTCCSVTGCSEFHVCGPRIEMEMEPVLLAISLEANLTDQTREDVA